MNSPDLMPGIHQIRERIRNAAIDAGRDPATIRLVAVSKTVPTDRVRHAITQGLTIIGESYIQEARDKAVTLSHLPVSWHFIGHLQSNKAKYAVRLFDLIHSVDSIKLAEELNRQAQKISKIQDILIQVNVAQEESKSGVSVDQAPALIREIARFEQVRIKGLMAIPPFFDDPERARPCFKAIRELSQTIAAQCIPTVDMTELSMGMSGDFEAAIAEGATLVRIGTAIFGTRS